MPEPSRVHTKHPNTTERSGRTSATGGDETESDTVSIIAITEKVREMEAPSTIPTATEEAKKPVE